MAFWLYSKSGDQYTRLQPVKFTGKSGLLSRFLHQHAKDDTPFSWELTPADIIALIDPTMAVDSHEILIDMLPESLTEVSLYRVTSIRGVSEFDESDLVLACKLFYQDKVTRSAPEFKKVFHNTHNLSERQMVEAFRLTGGVATGTYLWSKPKMDIGAAICPANSK